MNYLYIFEDGKVSKASGEIPDVDKAAADDGYLDIIDITNPDEPRQYLNNQWHPIKDVLE